MDKILVVDGAGYRVILHLGRPLDQLNDSLNEYKLVKKCNYKLTAPHCVYKVVTDIAVVSILPEGMRLDEVAPGWTPEEVQEMTEPKLIIPDEVPTMAF